MAAFKSPFFVVEEFISPKLCEQLIYNLDVTVPNYDSEDRPLKTVRTHDKNTEIVYERLLRVIPKIEQYYQLKYKGTESMHFEWFPEGSAGDLVCESSSYMGGKWVRTKARDITGVIFLNTFQNKIPFEGDFEVYGGKLEFPQHGFGFNPQRGTMVLYPSDPHFINKTTDILAGDLFQVRFHMAASQPYIYMPEKFPGTYKEWFKPLL